MRGWEGGAEEGKKGGEGRMGVGMEEGGRVIYT